MDSFLLHREKLDCDEIYSKMILPILDQFTDVKQHEVCIYSGASLQMQSEGSTSRKNINKIENHVSVGLGLRICDKSKRLVACSCMDLRRSAIEKLIKNTVGMMRNIRPDPSFISYSPEIRFSKIASNIVFDQAIHDITEDQVMDSVHAMRMKVREIDDSRLVQSVLPGFSAHSNTIFIANSNGLKVIEDHTSAASDCTVLIKHDDEMDSDIDYVIGRKLRDVTGKHLEIVATNAFNKARMLIGKQEVKSGTYPVIFTERATATMLLKSLAEAMNAESIQQKNSYLKSNDVDLIIAPDHVTLIDDGRSTRFSSIGTSSFDAEGYPTRMKKLIDRGQLSMFLHNTYTASKMHTDPTGNASRMGLDQVGIGVTNMYFDPPSDYTIKDDALLNEFENGIMIDDSGDSVNLLTGDFQGMATKAFFIENGEIKYPINQCVFAFNMNDVIKRIVIFGKDVIDFGGLIARKTWIDKMQIASNE